MHVVDAKKGTSKFTKEFILQIFTYNKAIESYSQGNQIEELKGSWLNMLKTEIEMVKEIKPEFDDSSEDTIRQDECIMKHPQLELIDPRESIDSVPMTEKKIRKPLIK